MYVYRYPYKGHQTSYYSPKKKSFTARVPTGLGEEGAAVCLEICMRYITISNRVKK